jgi:hypothetical protein
VDADRGGGVRGHRLISYPLSQKVKWGGGSSFFPFIFIYFPYEILKKRIKILIIFFQKYILIFVS